jgi:pimeloyl-ACP methyl ester carboxylesterase
MSEDNLIDGSAIDVSVTLKANGLRFSAIDVGSGPVVLFLHGFPDTPHTFKHQISALVDAGYRCIAPVMRGYEPSSQVVNGDYSVDTLASDVVGWLDHLGLEKVHLVGHDWGAAVSYATASKYPQRFYSLSTLAVPHAPTLQRNLLRLPIQLLNSSYMIFFQLRGLADWVVKRNNFAFLRFLWRVWSPDWPGVDKVFPQVQKTFAKPGVVKASLGYYRSLFSRKHRQTASSSYAPIQVPTLAMTGINDGCMDTRVYKGMEQSDCFTAGIRVEPVVDAGHFLQLEQPQAISELLINWINKHQPEQQINDKVSA